MTLADAIVDRELPCAGCEYDLRGLPIDGRCPECGELVGTSAEGHTLHHADPRWLRRLMIAGWLVPAGAAGVVLLIWGETMVPTMATATGRALVGAVFKIAAEVVAIAGLALLLWQRPNRFLDRPAMRRIGLGAIALVLVCSLVIEGLAVVMTWRADVAGGSLNILGEYTAMARAMNVVGSISNLAMGVALCVVCSYTAALLRRAPRSPLPWWFSLAGWVIGVSWAVAWLMTLAQDLGWYELSSPDDFPAMTVTTAAFLAVVVTGYAGGLLAIVLSPLAALRLGRIRRTAVRLREGGPI